MGTNEGGLILIFQYFCNRCHVYFFDSRKQINGIVCPVCRSSSRVEFLQEMEVD